MAPSTQAAREALARLDTAYSHGESTDGPAWSDLTIVLDYAREAMAWPEFKPSTATPAPPSPKGGQMQIPLGGTSVLPGVEVAVKILDIRTEGSTTYVRLDWVSPPGDDRSGTCKSCGRGFSPSHDITAPGPTSRHPFFPVKHPTGARSGGA